MSVNDWLMAHPKRNTPIYETTNTAKIRQKRIHLKAVIAIKRGKSCIL